MQHPGVSVVVPCYNAERYIQSALRSVVSQAWPKLELIVVDDGSSDRGPDIVQTHFGNAMLIRQQNQGIAAARNAGLAAATNEWIAFIDADDYWLPGKLQKQFDALARHPEARMSYGAWHVWQSEESEPSAELLKMLRNRDSPSLDNGGPSGWIYTQLLLDCAVWTSTVLMNRSLLGEIGGFDESLRVGEDYDLWLRASRRTEIVRVMTPLALYRIHGTSTTAGFAKKNYAAGIVESAIQRWGLRSPDGSEISRAAVDRALSHHWRAFGSGRLYAADARAASGAAYRAISLWPGNTSAWKLLVQSVLCAARGRSE